VVDGGKIKGRRDLKRDVIIQFSFDLSLIRGMAGLLNNFCLMPWYLRWCNRTTVKYTYSSIKPETAWTLQIEDIMLIT
jgi:hypothetical protein